MSDVSKIYSNEGNPAVVELVDPACRYLLDVGCGDGANARLLQGLRPGVRVVGLTYSDEEAQLARRSMETCVVADLESALPDELGRDFDTILCSHVLEHLSYPEKVVARLVERLRPDGQLLIAVPNIAAWRTRWRLMKGDFRYEEFGVFDSTHLRFYTHETAADNLLSMSPGMQLVGSSVEGSVPLWPFRRLLGHRLSAWLDAQGCRLRPNLFGSQVLLQARKAGG